MRVQGYNEADLRRLRSVSVRPGGWSHLVKPKVTEYRDEQNGHWIKVIKSEFNTIRMRWSGQDAHIILPHLRLNPWVGITKERN